MQNTVKKNLVLLSYGNEAEYLRAIFCVLSFFAWYDRDEALPRIIIYTDKPDFFYNHLGKEHIEYYLITSNELVEMLNQTGFLHRRKVKVIDLTFQRYPDDDVLFLDSDTFIIAEPSSLIAALEPGFSYMHKKEYTINTGLDLFTSYNQAEYPQAFLRYILSRDFEIGGGVETFSGADYSWNSGVLGLHRNFSHYMDNVLELTDGFYNSSKWFISEQLAFSFILQRKTTIKPADHLVLHYWGKREKEVMDQLLIGFFKKAFGVGKRDKILIQNLTITWKKQLEIESIVGQAVASIKAKDWYYGTKKIVQLLVKQPFALRSVYNEVNQAD